MEVSTEHFNPVVQTTPQISLACPKCQTRLMSQLSNCSHCSQDFFHHTDWIDLCLTANEINDNTEIAYKHYSRFYAPIALLAYLIVWRGNFLKHVLFFRQLLRFGKNIVDVATGDGSLTRLALFGSKKQKPLQVIAMDISGSMLKKARKKIPFQELTLVRADVLQLPLESQSVSVLSCFGGFNSFPNGAMAMQELFRVMKPGGILRGSVLLLPKTTWRKNLVLDWIAKGYQTEIVTEEKFGAWVAESGFKTSLATRYGDVILFELKKPKNIDKSSTLISKTQLS